MKIEFDSNGNRIWVLGNNVIELIKFIMFEHTSLLSPAIWKSSNENVSQYPE